MEEVYPKVKQRTEEENFICKSTFMTPDTRKKRISAEQRFN